MRRTLQAVVLAALVLGASAARGEQWQLTLDGLGYGLDELNDVIQARDGGIVAVGFTNLVSPETTKLFLVKVDAAGDLLWERPIEEAYIGISLLQTRDGGFIISGISRVPDKYNDVVLLKTDGEGNVKWARSYGGPEGEEGISVQQTRDGGYVVAGNTWSLGSVFNSDVFLLKTDAEGNLEWYRTYGDEFDQYDSDYADAVRQTRDGGYVIVGDWEDVEGHNDKMLVIKTDAGGRLEWHRLLDGLSGARGGDVRLDRDGGILALGSYWTEGASQIYLVKFDLSGGIEWERTYGGANNVTGYTLRPTLDGGYVVGGNRSYRFLPADPFLLKLDGEWNEEWSATISVPDVTALIRGAEPLRDGGYAMAGYYRPVTAVHADAYIAYYRPDDLAWPRPDLKANGMEGPVSLQRGEPLAVTASLQARGWEGEGVEWWILWQTPLSSPLQWFSHGLPGGSWRLGAAPAFQGTAEDMDPFDIVDAANFFRGRHDFWFLVDDRANGRIDFGRAYYDGVTVRMK